MVGAATSISRGNMRRVVLYDAMVKQLLYWNKR
jgi:hypothetical protein